MADCPTACTSPAGPLGVRTMSQSKVAPSSNELEPRKAVVAPACPPQKSACCPGTGEDPSSKTIPLNTPNASSISGLSAVHRVASSFQGEEIGRASRREAEWCGGGSGRQRRKRKHRRETRYGQ